MTYEETQQKLEAYEAYRKARWIDPLAKWNDERVGMLMKLWGEGRSASQIAARLGGVSRNTVIGKVHRLGLSGRSGPHKVAARPRKREAFTDLGSLSGNPHTVKSAAARLDDALGVKVGKLAPRAYGEAEAHTAAMVAVDTPPPQALMVKLIDLESHHCRWPIGDAKTSDFGFCGCSKAPVGSYCEHHTKLGTVSLPARTNNPFLLPNIKFRPRKNEPLDELPSKAA